MNALFHTFVSYFAKGGALMAPIFGVSLIAWWLGVEKLLFLRKFRLWRKRFLHQVDTTISGQSAPTPIGFKPYDELLDELWYCATQNCRRCSWELLFREFMISAVPRLERGFTTMSAWISVAPLLGLLGTVSGMITTFKVITDFGLGNPNLTADGISVALITTQAGLTVAFPMMLLHNYLVNQARRMTSQLMIDGEAFVKRLAGGGSLPDETTNNEA
jgi:biopolymer transport protein ExbB